jgi:hypothetical protein
MMPAARLTPLLVAALALASSLASAQGNPGAASGGAQPRFGLDVLQLEFDKFLDDDRPDRGYLMRLAPSVHWQPARGIDLHAAVRIDSTGQSASPKFSDTEVEPGDTYVRWRQGDARFTVGAQTMIWGRVDELPLIDRVSRVDLARGPLDRLADRRLANWALRWEQAWGDYRSDLILLPDAMGARLPDVRSVWSPVDQANGQLLASTRHPRCRGSSGAPRSAKTSGAPAAARFA